MVFGNQAISQECTLQIQYNLIHAFAIPKRTCPENIIDVAFSFNKLLAYFCRPLKRKKQFLVRKCCLKWYDDVLIIFFIHSQQMSQYMLWLARRSLTAMSKQQSMRKNNLLHMFCCIPTIVCRNDNLKTLPLRKTFSLHFLSYQSYLD